MTIHKLKLKEEFVMPVIQHKKTFELRNDDRHFKVGDVIVFTDLDGYFYRQFMKAPSNCRSAKDYKPSPRTYEITYKLKCFTGLEGDYCVLAIKETPYTLAELEHLEKIGWNKEVTTYEQ